MLTRHRDELLRRLEHVIDSGSCEIKIIEIKRWYGRDRITKTVWADVLDHWSEVTDDDAALLVGEEDGTYTFIYGDGLTVAENSWWSDLRIWAGLEVK